MSEQESNLGFLSLLDADKFFKYYYGENFEHQVETRRDEYGGSDQHDDALDQRSKTDNDEEIANALQQQLLITGPYDESYNVEEDYQQFSRDVPQCHDPPKNYYDGKDGGSEEFATTTTTSCSSSTGRERHRRKRGGKERKCGLEIKDDIEIDVEIATRLKEINTAPHIPRVNKVMPSIDEAMSHKERLLHRLECIGLVEHIMEGDGNCQFRALSDQFYRMPEHHTFVRQEVVQQLRDHPEMYEEYVPMAYDDYLKSMMENGEWGDHVTLQAAADLYRVKIIVVTSYKDTCFIEIRPKLQKSQRVIYLSFWAELHYNSIYPDEGGKCVKDERTCTSVEVDSSWSPIGMNNSPMKNSKAKKKKWWAFLRKNLR